MRRYARPLLCPPRDHEPPGAPTRRRQHDTGVALLLGSLSGVFSLHCTASENASSRNAAQETADGAGAPQDAGEEAGLGDDAGAAQDVGTSSAASYPAPHPPAPRIVDLGGPILASPKIIPITYDGDPWRDDIEAFVATIGQTSYWASVTAEYGVGPATSGTPIHLPGPAPTTIDDAAVEKWIAGILESSGSGWPLPDGNTMYAIYYPPGTTYHLAGYGDACVYGNDWVTALPDGTEVPYIVMPRCPAWPGMTSWDSFTWTQSHEFAEEATDPTKATFETTDTEHVAWSWNPPFAEIADMCDYDYDLTTVTGLGTVQRAWSNQAAAAGLDPCVPAPSGVYFNSAPVLEDDVTMTISGTETLTTKGVKIPVGQTRTIDVDLFSSAPTPGPWTVSAIDFTAQIWGGAPTLKLALDRTAGKNGDVLHLTITATEAGYYGGTQFQLTSSLGGVTTSWIGYVGN